MNMKKKMKIKIKNENQKPPLMDMLHRIFQKIMKSSYLNG